VFGVKFIWKLNLKEQAFYDSLMLPYVIRLHYVTATITAVKPETVKLGTWNWRTGNVT
jgi:hypothetical protein